MTWDSWPVLDSWWTRAVDTLRTKQSAANSRQPPSKRPAELPAADQPPKKMPSQLVMGIAASWLKEKALCIRFQLGSCKASSAPHDNPDTRTGGSVRHVCGGCLFLKKGEDSGHNMRTCPHKNEKGVFA